MTRHFDLDVNLDAKPDPLTFTIAVRDRTGAVVRKETFAAAGRMPLRLIGQLAITDTAVRVTNTAEFLAKAVCGDDLVRWEALADDPDVMIDSEDLLPLVKWLVEEWSQGPTGGPSGSPDGPMLPPTGSEAAAS